MMYASQLLLGASSAHVRDTLSMDLAFLTNDGFYFRRLRIAVLRSVPEPSGVLLLGLGGCAIWAVRRRTRTKSV